MKSASLSLYRQLLGGISLSLCIGLLLSAGLMYYLSFEDAHRLQDDLLVRLTQGDINDRLSLSKDTKPTEHEWAEQQIFLRPVSIATEPPLHIGFQSVQWQGQRYRAYSDGQQVALQQLEPRDELAAGRAWRSIVPFLITSPLILLVVYRLLRRSFYPVQQFSMALRRCDNQHFTPLDPAPLPEEWHALIFAFNDVLQRISAAGQQQQRFLADAAHELRTPLTALSLQAERLSALQTTPEQRQQIDELRGGIQRAARLIHQLLDINRINTATAQSCPHCCVREVLLDVMTMLYPIADNKQLELSLNCATDLHVAAGREDLALALRNLLGNAIAYTPAHGQVHIEISRQDKQLCLCIEDSGPGIPAEKRQQALEPFRRLHPECNQQGSGLGLAIVAAVAVRYHGHLSLDTSKRYGGLCVCLHLPRYN